MKHLEQCLTHFNHYVSVCYFIISISLLQMSRLPRTIKDMKKVSNMKNRDQKNGINKDYIGEKFF